MDKDSTPTAITSPPAFPTESAQVVEEDESSLSQSVEEVKPTVKSAKKTKEKKKDAGFRQIPIKVLDATVTDETVTQEVVCFGFVCIYSYLSLFTCLCQEIRVSKRMVFYLTTFNEKKSSGEEELRCRCDRMNLGC